MQDREQKIICIYIYIICLFYSLPFRTKKNHLIVLGEKLLTIKYDNIYSQFVYHLLIVIKCFHYSLQRMPRCRYQKI